MPARVDTHDPAWRRVATVGSLTEELFLLQMLGDDRAVKQGYVAGRAAKER